MKVFLDTNVLIAAFLSKWLCHELFEYCILNHQPVSSEFVINEFREKLVVKFKVSTESADEAVKLIREQTEIASEASIDSPVSRDPDDDHILAAAAGSKCDLIVTGDKDLLVLLQYDGIPIISPREFFDEEIADF